MADGAGAGLAPPTPVLVELPKLKGAAPPPAVALLEPPPTPVLMKLPKLKPVVGAGAGLGVAVGKCRGIAVGSRLLALSLEKVGRRRRGPNPALLFLWSQRICK